MKSKALGLAQEIWANPYKGSIRNKQKLGDIERLAEAGFSSIHIGILTGIPANKVEAHINPQGHMGGVRARFDIFNPKTLDAMYLMAVAYEDDEAVSVQLAHRIIGWGTGIYALSYYTGIPIERLRGDD